MLDTRILNFAKQMQIEMEHNNQKGDMFAFHGLQTKIVEVDYHYAKLLFAIKEQNFVAIKEYIADIANILLMIGNEYNFYNEEPVDTNNVVQMKTNLFEIVPLEQQVIKTKHI